jgi:hypothetical protein
MTTIWKAVLQWEDMQEISVPAGAEMLCAREQNEEIAVWFKCDPEAKKVPRKIAMCGTGHPAPDGRYLGTAALRGGKLMFHVFEVVH